VQERFTSKTLSVLSEPGLSVAGLAEFRFTDHYSIFHLGKMPDEIPSKGEAVCRMAVANMHILAAAGVPTHFRRAVGVDRMEFQLLRILNPARDRIQPGGRSYFVPLQVVFRNSLPAGASIFRRLVDGEVTLQELGLVNNPKPGSRLSRPVIEYMTKLDEIDNFISRATAQELAGLTDAQMGRLDDLVRLVDEVLSEKARSVGLDLADGKLEFGIDEQGHPLLVDTAGAPDESRFLVGDQHISKQVLRDCYSATGLRTQVRQWAARGRPPEEKPSPPSLGKHRIALVSDMYKALCERWLDASFWSVPDLETVMCALHQLTPLELTDAR
jgi:phosphoribosylaminoimidazole-succinocarboxamide synthase